MPIGCDRRRCYESLQARSFENAIYEGTLYLFRHSLPWLNRSNRGFARLVAAVPVLSLRLTDHFDQQSCHSQRDPDHFRSGLTQMTQTMRD